MNTDVAQFCRLGYVVVDSILSPAEVERWRQLVDDRLATHAGDLRIRRRSDVYGVRGLLHIVPELRELNRHPSVRTIVDLLPGAPQLVRGILFDKTADANWAVPWHQDLTIPVRERIDVPGFGPWSTKAGVPHVQPPVTFLRSMITLRLHLDDAPRNAGPLSVIPESHVDGRLDPEARAFRVSVRAPVACVATSGGVVAISPLILHTSARSHSNRRRRVLHLEFAACDLPTPLRWYESDEADAPAALRSVDRQP